MSFLILLQLVTVSLPVSLVHLNLRNNRIKSLDVISLIHLQELDVSQNNLQQLQLNKMRMLDLF